MENYNESRHCKRRSVRLDKIETNIVIKQCYDEPHSDDLCMIASDIAFNDNRFIPSRCALSTSHYTGQKNTTAVIPRHDSVNLYQYLCLAWYQWSVIRWL